MSFDKLTDIGGSSLDAFIFMTWDFLRFAIWTMCFSSIDVLHTCKHTAFFHKIGWCNKLCMHLQVILLIYRFLSFLSYIYIDLQVDAALDLSHTQNIGRMIKSHFPHSQVWRFSHEMMWCFKLLKMIMLLNKNNT